MTARLIYHMCKLEEWTIAQSTKIYRGSSQDRKDGFIHFSSGTQVVGSAAKHRAGQENLILIEVDAHKLGELLKWEISRNDESFPHLYGDLSLDAVTRSCKLELNEDGMHVFPDSWDLS